jgi:hypothetical protein
MLTSDSRCTNRSRSFAVPPQGAARTGPGADPLGSRRTPGAPTRPHAAATQPRPQQAPSGLPGTTAGGAHTRPSAAAKHQLSMLAIIPRSARLRAPGTPRTTNRYTPSFDLRSRPGAGSGMRCPGTVTVRYAKYLPPHALGEAPCADRLASGAQTARPVSVHLLRCLQQVEYQPLCGRRTWPCWISHRPCSRSGAAYANALRLLCVATTIASSRPRAGGSRCRSRACWSGTPPPGGATPQDPPGTRSSD